MGIVILVLCLDGLLANFLNNLMIIKVNILPPDSQVAITRSMNTFWIVRMIQNNHVLIIHAKYNCVYLPYQFSR